MRRREFLLGSAGMVAGALAHSAAEPAVTLAVGGDTTPGFNLQDHFDAELAAGRSPLELAGYYFAGIRPVLDAADIALVNLECPFTARGTRLPKNFNFRARPELVEILKAGAVDLVSLANNHINDWGPAGVADTCSTLDAAGIGRFGAGANLAAAREPLVMQRNGLTLGFLGYFFQDQDDMIEPRAVYATARSAGVAGVYTDLGQMRQMLREDLEPLVRRVDIPIVYFHWGKEQSYDVRGYQRELAQLCIDLGCRAVFGAHPHRLQGIEVYRGVPIFHSLGNFVYGGIKNPSDTLSMIARVRISRSSVAADVVPVEFTHWPDRPYQPVVLEGEAHAVALARIAQMSQGFPTLPTLPVLAR
jgi:poly-gamma-glutamate capsule biosynthesis protein CapA/YwtB (metallophosphatase superfamily)